MPRNVLDDAGAPLLAPVLSGTKPVLLAAPAAQTYELDEEGINSAVYDDLRAVRQMRGFLDATDRYLRQIMMDSEAGDG